jgi:ribosomal-protein-serine acetyltransferase
MGENLAIRDNISLQLLKMEDARTLFETTRKNDSHLRKWLWWLDDDKNVEDIQNYIRASNLRQEKQEGIDWLIWENEKLIWWIALDPLDTQNKKTAIMYWLTESSEGKWIMSDSLKILIHYIFETLKLNRIEIRCAIGNEKSSNIPKKLWFSYEWISRQSEWLYDHFVDLEIYSLLKNE